MVDFSEIPLELQLQEVHHCIRGRVGKGRKYPQFLLPMFLRRFPTIMDNKISVDWDNIMGPQTGRPYFPSL